MSLETHTHFDVISAGYVPEHHDEGNHRYLAEADQGAIGVASAWLAFYATAAVVVVASNFHKAANFVVAAN